MMIQGNFSGKRKEKGFSLFELVVVVAIIGIIAGIGIVGLTNTLKGVGESVAWDKVEILNMGLKKYSQIFHDMPTAADNASSDDEFLVLRSLQWREIELLGSPYVRDDYNPIESSSVDDYRIQWNGVVFELLHLGEAGTGLKIVDDGSDITSSHSFAADYAPE